MLLTGLVAWRYHHRMTPTAVKRARQSLGLSQSRFAALLDVHVTTIKRWEAGKLGMHPSTDKLIRLVVETQGRAPRARRRR